MNENYKKLLFAIHHYFQKDSLIIEWENGFKIKCKSVTGMMENDMESEDECYLGEYSIGVGDVEIIDYGIDNYVEIFNKYIKVSLNGTDNYIEIFNGFIEISLICIPVKVSLENGTVLWNRD